MSQSKGWSFGQVVTPAEAMKLAIREGRKGVGAVSPNPLVGCTIVDREHRVLAVGFHAKVGSHHAEINAINQIQDRSKLKGAHFYVTLEPCAHQGRTPSCAKTLAPLGPSSLTYAVEDPNPLVAGKGAAILREAGVKVSTVADHPSLSETEKKELIEAAEDLAEVFLHNMRTREPFVAIKVASTLDGKLAMSSGESKWITGEKAREHVHLIRARYDAVAIGRNTFVTDNPSLNVRHARFPSHVNKAVVFDPQGKTLQSMPGSNLVRVRDSQSVLVVVDEKAQLANPAGVKLVKVPTSAEGKFLMSELLRALKEEGLTSIMIEGGAMAYAEFLESEKAQRLHVYMAPVLLGARHSVAWSAGFGVESMAERLQLLRSRRKVLGADLYWTGRLRYVNRV